MKKRIRLSPKVKLSAAVMAGEEAKEAFSAVSAYTYGRNKNPDIKNGLIMMTPSIFRYTLQNK